MARSVTFKGNPVTLVGPEIQVGDDAPNVTVTATDFSDVRGSDLLGKVLLISVTPSLDTGVCDAQARRFNQEAAGLGQDVKVINISVDLPPALKRWCGAAEAENIVAVSDYKHREFGTKWGMLIQELQLLARGIFVVDRDGKVVYREVVPEVTDHVNFEGALQAARKAL
ncbi:MAG: thiol peroxidase [Armatimonadetes bacterium]|nr:thiol peroxidase [Armatimonadota bacterium]